MDSDGEVTPRNNDEREIASPVKKKKKKKKNLISEADADEAEFQSDDDDENQRLEEVQTRLFAYLHSMIQIKTVKLSVYQTFCQKF